MVEALSSSMFLGFAPLRIHSQAGSRDVQTASLAMAALSLKLVLERQQFSLSPLRSSCSLPSPSCGCDVLLHRPSLHRRERRECRP